MINTQLLNSKIITGPVLEIMRQLSDSGHQALIIGGAVRDALLGIEPKDFDIEVYNISYADLESFLSSRGKVDLVGKSFGIIKFKPSGCEESYDISVPRKENKIGIGHKAFEVTFDSSMTIREAGERRDFTFNAMAYDPIKDLLHDHFGGLHDLENKIIRHTSDSFKEDPLRVLRAMQFQARFGFEIHTDTLQIIREIMASGDFDSLPKERIFEEWFKWASKGVRHDLLFKFLRDTNLIDQYPELKILKDTEQDKIYHPEGDVEIHTTLALSVMDKIIERQGITAEEKAILVISILLHDIGKPATTEEKLKKDSSGQERMVITSHGHEALGGSMSKELLSRMGFHEALIHPICNLVADHLAGVSITSIGERRGMVKAVKKLSRRLHPATIKQLTYVMEADHNGRGREEYQSAKGSSELLEIANEINVQDKPYEYILMGRHLIEAGLSPSVRFGEILKKSYEAQENGEFQDLEGAKKWLTDLLLWMEADAMEF